MTIRILSLALFAGAIALSAQETTAATKADASVTPGLRAGGTTPILPLSDGKTLPSVMPVEVLATTVEVYNRLQGAAEATAAVEKAAKDAAAVRDQLQQQLGSLMGPWCRMAKIDPVACSVDLKTGAITSKPAPPVAPTAKP